MHNIKKFLLRQKFFIAGKRIPVDVEKVKERFRLRFNRETRFYGRLVTREVCQRLKIE